MDINTIVTLIITVVIPVLGAIVTYLIVPFLKEKTTKEQRDTIIAWVKIAVGAAEQMEKANLLKLPKKEYVIAFINEKGFNISREDLDAIIEAAVLELNIEKNKFYWL